MADKIFSEKIRELTVEEALHMLTIQELDKKLSYINSEDLKKCDSLTR